MKLLVSLALCALLLVGTPLHAQQREVPYWASLRSDEVNMRVGPSEDFPIAWVYKRKGLPIKVVRVVDGWRLVRDPDGEQGWIIARLLSPQRAALVTGEGLAEMRAEPDAAAALRWKVEPGVTGVLDECENGWCRFDVAGRAGWIRSERLWGAGDPKEQ